VCVLLTSSTADILSALQCDISGREDAISG
jgi:hypothetical protein